MLFCPNSLSCPKKLSLEYQLYACGNFFRHSSILEKIAILGQPPSQLLQSARFKDIRSYDTSCFDMNPYSGSKRPKNTEPSFFIAYAKS